MEECAYYVKLISNTLDYKTFENIVEKENKNDNYFINSIGLQASGRMTSEGFVVFK